MFFVCRATKEEVVDEDDECDFANVNSVPTSCNGALLARAMQSPPRHTV